MNTLTELNAIERAACRQAVERAKELDDLRAELAALKAQRDELVNALKHLLFVQVCPIVKSKIQRWSAAIDEANALLDKLERGGK